MSKSIINQIKAARKAANIKEDLGIEDKILSEGLSACLDQFKARNWDGEGELYRIADRVNGGWSDEDLVAYLSVETAADIAANLSNRMLEQQAISRPSWLAFCTQSLLQRCFLAYARNRRLAEDQIKRDVEQSGDGTIPAPYAGTQTRAFGSDALSEAEDAMYTIADEMSELYTICQGVAAEPLNPLSLSIDRQTMDLRLAYQLYVSFVAKFKAESKREYIRSLKAHNKQALNSGASDKEVKEALEQASADEATKLTYRREVARSLKEGKIPERGDYKELTSSYDTQDEIEEVMYTNGVQ